MNDSSENDPISFRSLQETGIELKLILDDEAPEVRVSNRKVKPLKAFREGSGPIVMTSFMKGERLYETLLELGADPKAVHFPGVQEWQA